MHIVVQPIHLGGKLTPHYSGEPPASIPGTSLPIPNALKSMMSDSNTPPAEPPTTGDSFVLEGEQELGVLPLTSRPIGFVFYRYLDRSYALSWNGTQLIVSEGDAPIVEHCQHAHRSLTYETDRSGLSWIKLFSPPVRPRGYAMVYMRSTPRAKLSGRATRYGVASRMSRGKHSARLRDLEIKMYLI